MTAYGYLGGDPSKLDADGYLQGDLPAANSSGVLVPVHIGTAGNVLTVNSGQPELLDYEPGGGGGGGTPSGSVVTEQAFGQASTAGVATTYSRGDHTHGTPAAPTIIAPATTVVAETSFGQASAVGVGVLYARQDHTHGTPTAPTAASVGAVPTGRLISTTAPIAGGGDLSADRTISLNDAGVTNAKLANMAANTVKGSVAGGVPADLSVAQQKTMLAYTTTDIGAQPLDSDLTTIAGLTATTGNMLLSASSAWTSATPATVKTALALNNLDNTSDANKPVSTAQQTALNLKANIASPTFTGTATFARQVNTPVVLADAATILVNASLGNTFRMTLTTTGRTLGNPSSPVDGQMLLFEIIQSAAGSLTLNLDTKFAFGTGITSFTMTATANKRDFLGCFYNSTADKFFIIALAQGY